MTTPIVADGTSTIDGTPIPDGLEVVLDQNYDVISAEPAYGETAIPQAVTFIKTSGSVRFRYTSAAYDTMSAFFDGAAHALVNIPEAGAGKNQFTGNVIFTSCPVSHKARQYPVVTMNFVGSDGTAFAKTPTIVITPASLELTAQVGVSGTVCTFAATGGATASAWTIAGSAPGLSVSAATGVYSGTPITASQGVYSLPVTFTDQLGRTKTQTYTLTVAPA